MRNVVYLALVVSMALLVLQSAALVPGTRTHEDCGLSALECLQAPHPGFVYGSDYIFSVVIEGASAPIPTEDSPDAAAVTDALAVAPAARINVTFSLTTAPDSIGDCSEDYTNLKVNVLSAECDWSIPESPDDDAMTPDEMCNKTITTNPFIEETRFQYDQSTGEIVGVVYRTDSEALTRLLVGAIQSVNVHADYSQLSEVGSSYSYTRPSMRTRGREVTYKVTLKSLDNGTACFDREGFTSYANTGEESRDGYCLDNAGGPEKAGANSTATLGDEPKLRPALKIVGVAARNPASDDFGMQEDLYVLDWYGSAQLLNDGSSDWVDLGLTNMSVLAECPNTPCVLYAASDGQESLGGTIDYAVDCGPPDNSDASGTVAPIAAITCVTGGEPGSLATYLLAASETGEAYTASCNGEIECGQLGDWQPIDGLWPSGIYDIQPLNLMDKLGVGAIALSTTGSYALAFGDVGLTTPPQPSAIPLVFDDRIHSLGASSFAHNSFPELSGCDWTMVAIADMSSRVYAANWTSSFDEHTFVAFSEPLLTGTASVHSFNAECGCRSICFISVTEFGDVFEVNATWVDGRWSNGTFINGTFEVVIVPVLQDQGVYMLDQVDQSHILVGGGLNGSLWRLEATPAEDGSSFNWTQQLLPTLVPQTNPHCTHPSCGEEVIMPTVLANATMDTSRASVTALLPLEEAVQFVPPCTNTIPFNYSVSPFYDPRWTAKEAATVPHDIEATIITSLDIFRLHYTNDTFVEALSTLLSGGRDEWISYTFEYANRSLGFPSVGVNSSVLGVFCNMMTSVRPATTAIADGFVLFLSNPSTEAWSPLRLAAVYEALEVPIVTDALIDKLSAIARNDTGEANETIVMAAASVLGSLDISSPDAATTYTPAHVHAVLKNITINGLNPNRPSSHPPPHGALLGIGNLGHEDAPADILPILGHVEDTAVLAHAVRALRQHVGVRHIAQAIMGLYMEDRSPRVRAAVLQTMEEHAHSSEFESDHTVLHSILRSLELTKVTPKWTELATLERTVAAYHSRSAFTPYPHRGLLHRVGARIRFWKRLIRAVLVQQEVDAFNLKYNGTVDSPLANLSDFLYKPIDWHYPVGSRDVFVEAYAVASFSGASEQDVMVADGVLQAGLDASLFGNRVPVFAAGVGALYNDGRVVISAYITAYVWRPWVGPATFDLFSRQWYGHSGIKFSDSYDRCTVDGGRITSPGYVNRMDSTLFSTTLHYGIPIIADLQVGISVGAFVEMGYGLHVFWWKGYTNGLAMAYVNPGAGASGSLSARISFLIFSGGVQGQLDLAALSASFAIGANLPSTNIGYSLHATQTFVRGSLSAFWEVWSCCRWFWPNCGGGCNLRRSYSIVDWPGWTFNQQIIKPKSACTSGFDNPLPYYDMLRPPSLNQALLPWTQSEEAESGATQLPFDIPEDALIFLSPRFGPQSSSQLLDLGVLTQPSLEASLLLWSRLQAAEPWSRYWLPIAMLSDGSYGLYGGVNVSFVTVLAVDCKPKSSAASPYVPVSPCPEAYRAIAVSVPEPVFLGEELPLGMDSPLPPPLDDEVKMEAPSLRELVDAIVLTANSTDTSEPYDALLPSVVIEHGLLAIPNVTDPDSTALVEAYAEGRLGVVRDCSFLASAAEYPRVIQNHFCYMWGSGHHIYPASPNHYTVTKRSAGKAARRDDAQFGIKTLGQSRDEFPYASTDAGGCQSRVQLMSKVENGAHGIAWNRCLNMPGMGHTYPDGTIFDLHLPAGNDLPFYLRANYDNCRGTDARIQQGKAGSPSCSPRCNCGPGGLSYWADCGDRDGDVIAACAAIL